MFIKAIHRLRYKKNPVKIFVYTGKIHYQTIFYSENDSKFSK